MDPRILDLMAGTGEFLFRLAVIAMLFIINSRIKGLAGEE